MYSVGLIMYELYSVFGTAMERVYCLNQARHHATLPDAFKQQFPVHVNTCLIFMSQRSILLQENLSHSSIGSNVFMCQVFFDVVYKYLVYFVF